MLATRVYKLYASVSTDTNAAASIRIQAPGIITAILFSGLVNSVNDDSDYRGELSFANVSSANNNDSIGPIADVRGLVNILTSGAYLGQVNQFVGGLQIPVDSGTLLYVNFDITGTITVSLAIYVYVLQNV